VGSQAKDTIFTAGIVNLAHDGRGVADADGQRIFVADALPGERVSLTGRRRRRRVEEAQLVEVLEASPDRVTPGCPYFGRCGGCVLQHLEPAAQLAAKAVHVAEVFERIGKVMPLNWLPPVTGPVWNYRRRARLSVRYVPGKGRVLVGFRERGNSYIADMADCAVLARPTDGLVGPLADMISDSSVRQRLSQIETAVGDGSAAIVLRVLDAPTPADLERFADFSAQHDVDVLLQTGGVDSVRPLNPDTFRPLYYRLPDFDLRLDFQPLDFVQINGPINERLVAGVVELLQPQSSDRVLDLFCGLGNFSLALAQRAGEVVGVEGAGALVERARANASINGLGNTRFVKADLAAPGAAFAREQWDLVLLDPPRSGAAVVVDDIPRMAPRAIAYVSCHPATLARDAQRLVHDLGYTFKAAGVLDMFPHTHHVEVMALFERG
jgi:23S rRNA (uracil1939-C5)-methyltransferase